MGGTQPKGISLAHSGSGRTFSARLVGMSFALEEDDSNKGKYKAFQVQWNPPNFPLFALGTQPFHGSSPILRNIADSASPAQR